MLVFNFICNWFIAFPSDDQAAEESEETEDQAVPKGKMGHYLTLTSFRNFIMVQKEKASRGHCCFFC